ncbi:MAG TPA: YncE family protein [Bryobacteraceae bacterium]|jgi:DNA-binding beta-propeller fold protein YncE|nr:YncE family protein [Bryobacteraceae bacterium]
MKKSLLVTFIALCTSAFAAPPTYKVIDKIKIGGPASWDYVFVDSANHRLYVSHATQTEVIDTNTDKLVGTIPGTNGVHGIAIADDLGRGFTSDGKDNDVTIFDIKTLAVLGKVKTGTNPDAIIYEPVTHRVLTFNGRSSDSTVFDAKTGAIVAASVAVGGKPEFAQVDGKGNVYFNNEDKGEVGVIDAKTATLIRHYSIAPCDGPSGLAIDPKEMHLFSVCGKKVMAISDGTKLIGTADIGLGVDGVAFDDGYAFSANGRDGTITMVAETSPGKFAAVATIPTTQGARTIGADQKAHKLYLPAAQYGPPGESKDGKAARPQALPDSFMIVVVGR